MRKGCSSRGRCVGLPVLACSALLVAACSSRSPRGPFEAALWRAFRDVPHYDAEAVQSKIAALAARARARISPVRPEALGRWLFSGKKRFRCESKVFRPDEVLQKHAGNCLGLSTVFVLVAADLGIDAHILLRAEPPHAVVSCSGHVWDPTDGFAPIDPQRVRAWKEVGKNGWYGVPLTPRRAACVELSSAASEAFRRRDGALGAKLSWEAFALDSTECGANDGIADACLLEGNWAGVSMYARRALETDPGDLAARQLQIIARRKGQGRGLHKAVASLKPVQDPYEQTEVKKLKAEIAQLNAIIARARRELQSRRGEASAPVQRMPPSPKSPR